MTTIEDILDKNRSQLDQIELPVGHRERMQARLAAASRKRHRRHIALWISSASAVAAVIALALWVAPINDNAPQPLTAAQIKIDTTKQTPITTANVDTTMRVIVAQVKNTTKPRTKQANVKVKSKLIDEVIEVEEVERYYQAKRDEAIESVDTLLYDKNPTEIARIKHDLALLTEGFKSDTLPKSLLIHNPGQYVAMTIDRLVAQREIIDRLKYSISNI